MCHFCSSLDFYWPTLEHTRPSTDIANLIIWRNQLILGGEYGHSSYCQRRRAIGTRKDDEINFAGIMILTNIY